MLTRWKKSVVHLEMAADTMGFNEVNALQNAVASGSITQEEFNEAFVSYTRDIRSTGTAFLACDNDDVFLITAKHNLYNKDVAKDNISILNDPANLSSITTYNLSDKVLSSLTNAAIVRMIFRVPSFDEIENIKSPVRHSNFLMNLGAGSDITRSFTFSDDETDLAVICLTHPTGICSQFWEGLRADGYDPIPLSWLASVPPAEGAEILTVGFPGNVSDIQRRSGANKAWESDLVSLPAFTFGRVSMSHPMLDCFWGDITTMPGNSGGPVISNEQVVGVVSGQAFAPTDDEQPDTGFPVALVINASKVLELVKAQKARNLAMAEILTPSSPK